MSECNEKLVGFLEGIGVAASSSAADTMLAFEELVLARNEVINLTAITEHDAFVTKHLIDSCSCYGWPEIEEASRIVDVGTGAGFPGIPLAILYPEKSFTLIDSLGKRTDFINDAAGKLGILNVAALHMRAEDAGRAPDLRENFNLCVTRAVASMSVLEEYCLPMLKIGGFMYAYKTKNAEDELRDDELARSLLGGARIAESRHINEDLPLSRRIFVIRKDRATPKDYPRKAGIPSKIPL